MTTFSMTPAPEAGNVPQANQNFPKQIQFRWNGVNLGGPDATVVNFVGDGFTVTRGTGADANKVTIEVT
jgi:hypothetical protein